MNPQETLNNPTSTHDEYFKYKKLSFFVVKYKLEIVIRHAKNMLLILKIAEP
jgi:hypothetical protein